MPGRAMVRWHRLLDTKVTSPNMSQKTKKIDPTLLSSHQHKSLVYPVQEAANTPTCKPRLSDLERCLHLFLTL
jgi:hypothetical protein